MSEETGSLTPLPGILRRSLSKSIFHCTSILCANYFSSTWNTTFGTPPSAQTTSAPSQQPSLKISVSGAPEPPSLPDIQSLPNVSLPPGGQMPPHQYSGAPMPSFVSPSMWQESVASVYENGLKRHWDYDDNNVAKRTR